MPLKYADIADEFISTVHKDARAAHLAGVIEAGRGSYVTAGQYAARVGDLLGRVLRRHAPVNGISDWDVESLIPGVLGADHNMVIAVTNQVQANMNAVAGIYMRVQTPAFNGNRAYGIVTELLNNPEFVNIERSFYDQLTNFSMSVVDDAIRDNAAVQSAAGYSVHIKRTAEYGACAWCEDVAGVYDFASARETVGNDLWKRHENCRCTIDYTTRGRTERVQNYRRPFSEEILREVNV